MHSSQEAINGYVDGTLDAAQRAEVEQHLHECLGCRQLADDLAEIRRVASSLELRQPPAEAWARLERAIARDAPDERQAVAVPQRWTKDPRSLAWLAAAAVLVIATAIGIRYATRGPATPRPPAAANANGAAPPAMSAEAVEAELRAAEAHYENAIKGLEQIATSERSALDPNTAATLQKNLAVIDQAISESRAAVRAQPASEPAVSSLMDAFKTKLALLQDTVSLINEMRKGNEAGTARAVSGLKQKGN